MVAGLSLKTGATFMTLLIPWATTEMLKTVVPTGKIVLVILWGGMMLIMAGMDLTGNIIANRMASLVARNTTERIRLQLFAKISYLSLADQEKLTGESLISRATSDTYNVHHFLGMMQRFGVRQPIILVVSVIITFFMDVQLALVVMIIVPIMGVTVFLFMKYGRPLYKKVQEALDHFVLVVREDVNGIRVIKALSKGDTERKRFHKINEDVVKKNQKANLVMGGMHPLVRFLLNAALVLIVWFGAKRVNSGLAASETLLAFMTYITMILNAVINLTRFVLQYTQASVSGNRIAEILNTENSLKQEPETDDEKTIEERKEKGMILFDHVSFAYDKHLSTLEDISFSVKKGDMLGIIGATGSGKSAVVNLMMRFYDTGSGGVYIDGRNVRNYDNQELKGKFGAVFQNDLIFRDTIRENIRFGRDISDEEIMRAARAAQAEFVFERGLDEKLTIRGSNLSGGQKQRIYIARALAGRPEILVLDDASSALDYATDASLREAIRREYPDTTLVVVAQRISSIMNANDILVLDEGKLIGQGTHRELMKTCSVYREISESQMGEGNDNGLTEEVKAEFVRMSHDHPAFRDTETYEDVLKRVEENQKAFAKRGMYRECIATVKDQLEKENQELGSGGKKRVFVRLLKYLFRHPFLIISALVLTIASNVLVLVVPKLSGFAIDAFGTGAGNVNFPLVTEYCVQMVAAIAISSVIAYLTTVV
ncbi:MAG: ATP-binding cassette domain-containing protein, partial [Lachnospiraceae bacterium]|nr:ATP-binding cassette domain-containing protein [Lachnospiraceae bacterium]